MELEGDMASMVATKGVEEEVEVEGAPVLKAGRIEEAQVPQAGKAEDQLDKTAENLNFLLSIRESSSLYQ